MSDATARFALPFIAPGQAQKELFHNEALVRIDAALQAVAETIGDAAPPPAPTTGQCWIVGTGPTGDWAGQANALAAWSEGGWRFVAPVAGMSVWLVTARVYARFDGAAWQMGDIVADRLMIGDQQVVGARQAAIINPVGGTVVDAESRAALASILVALRAHGLVAE